MSIVLETIRERERRVARERFMRRAGRFAGLMSLVFIGVAVATPVAYQRGVEAERERVADAPKPARPAPTGGLTQWKCDGAERREYLNTCANRLRQELLQPKEIKQ